MHVSLCFRRKAVRREILGVLSAGEERALTGHDVALLGIGAQLPGCGDKAEHDEAHDGGVLPPVRRLAVPATGRRPDVLGVAIPRY